MSTVMPGLVETSLNLGILKLEDQALLATSSVRSSVSSRKEDLRDRLEHIAEFLGGEIAVSGDYPAWEYQAKSEIRDTISAVYEELFQEEPVFEAIHAGLECGILPERSRSLTVYRSDRTITIFIRRKSVCPSPRPRKYGSFWWHF